MQNQTRTALRCQLHGEKGAGNSGYQGPPAHNERKYAMKEKA